MQWIPADVIALFTLGITALRTQQPDPNPSTALLVGGLILAPILVIAGACTSRRRLGKKDFTLAGLSVAAFAIWSLAVPDSGWYDIKWVVNNPGWVAIIAAVAGVLFGIIASILGDSAS